VRNGHRRCAWSARVTRIGSRFEWSPARAFRLGGV